MPETETGNPELATSESEFTEQQTIQIVTRLDQVEEMISKGWRLVATIPENKAVVEKNGAESDLFELTVGVDWRGCRTIWSYFGSPIVVHIQE